MILRTIQAEIFINGDFKLYDDVAGREGENDVTQLAVVLPTSIREGWIYIEYTNAVNERIESERQTVDDDGIIHYPLPYNLLKKEGEVFVQLIARQDADGDPVFKSPIKKMNVLESINAEQPEEYDGKDFFTELQRVSDQAEDATAELEEVKSTTLQARDATIQATNEMVAQLESVGQNATIATEKAGIAVSAADQSVSAKNIVVEKAAEVEANADQVAENTDDVAENTQVTLEKSAQASQALADLLAMLGTDICPLVDGHVPADKIDLILTHEIVPITDVNQLTTLTVDQVQKGDTAYIISGTGDAKKIVQSFVLLDADPSIRSNWAEVATSYASTAAYAATAGQAENANTINGHRIVYMTQAQYDAAVKDAETIYMVGV